MLAHSSLLASLRAFTFSPASVSAYPLHEHVQVPIRNALSTPQMEVHSHSLSSVRSLVEWLFGDIVNYFKFIDLKEFKNLLLSFHKYRYGTLSDQDHNKHLVVAFFQFQ